MNSIADSFRFLLSDITGVDDCALPMVPDGVPETLRSEVADAIAALIAYQGPSYAELYVHRLRRFARRRDVDAVLLGLIAREMTRRMCYDDPIRIAQHHLATMHGGEAATSRHRFRLEELFGALPGKFGRPLLMGCEHVGWTHLPISMRFNACSGPGRLRLRLEASLRRWRLFSARYASERAWVERWLHMIDRSLTKQPAAALAITGTAAMVQGSGDVYRRGLTDWHALIDSIVKPALDGALPLADLSGVVTEIVALSRAGAPSQVATAIARIREGANLGA
ncbi:MAG: hypothetical protein J0H71_08395 [Rhizobiales bacterium]|nr:hypothetical protein [Hyphomicrobiales bacterium]